MFTSTGKELTNPARVFLEPANPSQRQYAALRAYFATADLFVSASEHEGFCVPILESLHSGVAVVAFGAAAVPETVGDAGLVVRTKEPAALAAGWWRVLGDGALRARLVVAGKQRARAFDLDHARAKLFDAIDVLIGTRG